MERKAIIELAKDKGMTEFVPIGSNALWEQIEKFVAFAVEEEREACALICDKEQEVWGWDSDVIDPAREIRARGQT